MLDLKNKREMPYKDSKNPKLLAYKKAYYLRTKESLRASRKASAKRWMKRNKEVCALYNLILRESKPENKASRLEFFREYEKKQAENLSTLYLKKQLKKDGFTKEHIEQYPELLETKKIILKTKRLWRQSTTSMS